MLQRDVLWEDTLKLSASAATSELCEWVQVGIDVYIYMYIYIYVYIYLPYIKYQVKPQSS